MFGETKPYSWETKHEDQFHDGGSLGDRHFRAFCDPGAAKTAKAAPATAAEHYCLSYEAGSECGFTTYAQCEAMAAGIGGDCRQEPGDRTRAQPAQR
jgi:hypothetical protein